MLSITPGEVLVGLTLTDSRPHVSILQATHVSSLPIPASCSLHTPVESPPHIPDNLQAVLCCAAQPLDTSWHTWSGITAEEAQDPPGPPLGTLGCDVSDNPRAALMSLPHTHAHISSPLRRRNYHCRISGLKLTPVCKLKDFSPSADAEVLSLTAALTFPIFSFQ